MWTMNMQKITMKQMYPNMLLGDGIMSDLSDLSVPWSEAVTSGDISTVFLDMGYFSHSGQKIIAPIIFDISENIENIEECNPITPLTTTQRTKIAGMLKVLFGRKWQRIWDLSNVSYNPINNYDMSEIETFDVDTSNTTRDSGTVTNVIDDETTNTGTVTNVIDDTETNTGTVRNVKDTDTSQTGTVQDVGSNSVDNGLYGFNSSVSVGSDNSYGSVTNTKTNNLAGTDDTTETRTDNLTRDTDTTETRTDNLTSNKDSTETETRNLTNTSTGTRDVERTLERAGNIGVTTTQKMVVDELEAWQWTFFQTVFEDIDSVCCLDIY